MSAETPEAGTTGPSGDDGSRSGMGQQKNGELLRLAEGRFDVFITIDQKVTYQQNLRNASLAIIVLAAENNRVATLKLLIPKVREALRIIQPGQAIRVAG